VLLLSCGCVFIFDLTPLYYNIVKVVLLLLLMLLLMLSL